MSLLAATVLTAWATLALAVLAFITAILAGLAFLKQSREVRAIESQVSDGQEVARQQAGLLKVQTGQLEVLRAQLEDQRKAAAAQAEVINLQAAELTESLKERKREADERQRSQAAKVTAWFAMSNDRSSAFSGLGALVRNASDLPIFNVRVFFHMISSGDGGDWVPVNMGGPPPDETVPVIPPSTERLISIPANVRAAFGITTVSDTTCVVSMEFTDAAGNRWERDPRGALNPRS